MAARDKVTDVDGLALAVEALSRTRRRKASLAQLTGGSSAGLALPLVVASAASCLGYEERGGELCETEFGYRKRTGEDTVRASGLPHLIVRSAVIDDVRTE